MKISVCSVCGLETFLMLSAEIGPTMCDMCKLLGIIAQQEVLTSGVRPNIWKPDTFNNKPATCALYLYSYFGMHPKVLIH